MRCTSPSHIRSSTLPVTKGEKNNSKKKKHIYVRVRARACKLKATVIPTLHTPIAAKPPTIRGLRPNFSMVKHCRQRRIQKSKHIKVTIVVSSHKDRKGTSLKAHTFDVYMLNIVLGTSRGGFQEEKVLFYSFKGKYTSWYV